MDFETKNLESATYIQDIMKHVNKIIYIWITVFDTRMSVCMYAFIYCTMYGEELFRAVELIIIV